MKKLPYSLFAFILFIQIFDILSLNVWKWIWFPYITFEFTYHVYDTMVSMCWLMVYTVFWWLGKYIEDKNEKVIYSTITGGVFWFGVNDLIQYFLNEQSNYDKWEWYCFYLFLGTTAITIVGVYRKEFNGRLNKKPAGK